MIGFHPVIVMDCWEHSYYRDYLKDRKTYVFAMMKELDWNVIENRIKIADQIHGLLK
jgi:superoxide dismutase